MTPVAAPRPEDRVIAKPDVLCKELSGESVLLDLETETYFGLNETGARLWTLLTTSPSIGRAVATMLDEYDVPPDELERDARELVQELLDRGLVRLGHA